MGDLRSESDRRKQLIDHIAGREGNYPWFYLDGMGLVTIGKGTLVAKEHDARSAAAAVNFTFASNPTKIARADEVAADWRRVHDKQDLKNKGAKAYKDVAQLRISDAAVDQLVWRELTPSVNSLYRQHAFMLQYGSRVAMALVDTRYNAAGINPYSDPKTKKMWAALDPANDKFDPVVALEQFKSIWAHRGGKYKVRYAERHRQRVQWFRDGLAAMYPDRIVDQAELPHFTADMCGVGQLHR